ncbi:trypsin-like peptidase domain-containing protein [Paenibacillus sp. FSL H8-0537]|uniref:S1C family serine protease n=1 Tax=Paenibacillus sp. FSL H8-0537 TaxID=2921399 RepID=UPI003100EABC
MDDQNKKNGFDDFFQNREDGQQKQEDNVQPVQADEASADSSEQASKPSYYYSYGPFKSGAPDNNVLTDGSGAGNQPISTPAQASSQEPAAASQPYSQQQGDQASFADSMPPAPVRPFSSSQSSARGGWQVKEPQRRTSFKAMFSSFIAGVLVVGSLMYAADVNNWFSKPAEATVSQQGTATATGQNSGLTAASDRPDDIAKLFETSSPAVVKIETFASPARSNGGSSADSFFEQFFGQDYPGAGSKEQNNNSNGLQATGSGTGFFFDASGYILTNQHVVGGAEKIEVTVQGYDKPLTAQLLGSDYNLDLAVLKVTDTKAFPTLKLGSSDSIKIGDWVAAIGNPYGFDHTITVGVLSAKERPISIPDEQGTRNYEHLLQTDASINPGNSGGPLLNVNGEVIGINTAVSSQAQGIGFAIPTSTIQGVLENLKNNVEVPKDPVPFIGAELADVTDAMAKQLGMDKAEGSIVSNVYYNSPAYLGDLKQFDVIIGIDGKVYNNTQDLIAAIKKRAVGDGVQLNIIRKGAKMDLTVTIGDRNKFNAEK